ncbi:MAG: GPP34 family phosphoprotein [Candidatus Aminicenantes bacterium]|nr:GPP34 family phosphoprotein [Candidatus Aminicenantes bacterium]
MELTLAEELLLLALKDEKGTILLSASSGLHFGLAGAALMELFLMKKADVQDKRLAAAGTAGPKDPILNEIWQAVRDKEKPKAIRFWVEKYGRTNKLRNRCLDRLVEKGILAREKRKVLFVFPGNRYPTANPRPESEERLRLRRAVLDHKPVEPRTVMLLSLIQACDLVGEIFPKPEKKEAKKRIKEMVKNEEIGRVVAQEIAAGVAACIVASTVASCAASG